LNYGRKKFSDVSTWYAALDAVITVNFSFKSLKANNVTMTKTTPTTWTSTLNVLPSSTAQSQN